MLRYAVNLLARCSRSSRVVVLVWRCFERQYVGGALVFSAGEHLQRQAEFVVMAWRRCLRRFSSLRQVLASRNHSRARVMLTRYWASYFWKSSTAMRGYWAIVVAFVECLLCCPYWSVRVCLSSILS